MSTRTRRTWVPIAGAVDATYETSGVSWEERESLRAKGAHRSLCGTVGCTAHSNNRMVVHWAGSRHVIYRAACSRHQVEAFAEGVEILRRFAVAADAFEHYRQHPAEPWNWAA
jgi:hypothetical protein